MNDIQVREHERSAGVICPSTTGTWREMPPAPTFGNADPYRKYRLRCNECNGEVELV